MHTYLHLLCHPATAIVLVLTRHHDLALPGEAARAAEAALRRALDARMPDWHDQEAWARRALDAIRSAARPTAGPQLIDEIIALGSRRDDLSDAA